jgi:hypothetical protein
MNDTFYVITVRARIYCPSQHYSIVEQNAINGNWILISMYMGSRSWFVRG